MKNPELEKSKIFDVSEMSKYVPHGVVTKTILKKATGNVNVVFIASGEQLSEKFSRFDHFIQIIEGKASIFIDDNTFNLATGQSIIIPAHSRNTIKANEQFKMISTIIKSGYE